MDDPSKRKRGIFAKLATASEFIKTTAASASEVLVDKDLRRHADLTYSCNYNYNEVAFLVIRCPLYLATLEMQFSHPF
jgi:hypothetical protein